MYHIGYIVAYVVDNSTVEVQRMNKSHRFIVFFVHIGPIPIIFYCKQTLACWRLGQCPSDIVREEAVTTSSVCREDCSINAILVCTVGLLSFSGVRTAPSIHSFIRTDRQSDRFVDIIWFGVRFALSLFEIFTNEASFFASRFRRCSFSVIKVSFCPSLI